MGSRHHFGTFISMALLIQFTVGRLSIAYFSPCWNRHSGFISTGAAHLTPSTLSHPYKTAILPNIKTQSCHFIKFLVKQWTIYINHSANSTLEGSVGQYLQTYLLEPFIESQAGSEANLPQRGIFMTITAILNVFS